MNKKLFLGALLVGAIALNSCVDDKESASVTNVREAKAEQLKAVGEAEKTKAEAEKIAAEADAKVKEAQAKLIAAQEAAQVAQTQIDKEKAAAEIQRLQEQLASEIAVANANIEKIKAQAENQLLLNQKQLLANQDEQNTQLTTLLTDYSTATTDLVGYQRALVTAQNDLAAWEADLVSWKELRPERIAAKQEDIKKVQQAITDNDAKLVTLEQYYGNVAAAKDQLAKAQAESELLLNKYSAASADKEKARQDRSSAYSKISNSRYRQILSDSILEYNLWSSIGEWESSTEMSFFWGIRVEDDTLNIRFHSWNKDTQQESDFYIPLYSVKSEWKTVTGTYEEGQKQLDATYVEYPSTYYVLTEDLYTKAVDALNNYVKKNQEANVTAAQKAYNDFVKAADAVANADAELQAAQKDVDDVLKGGGTPTEAQQKAVTDKQTAYDAAHTAYENAYGWYDKEDAATKKERLSTSLTEAQTDLANAQAAIAKFKSSYKSLNAQLDAYQGYISAYKPLSKAWAESDIAYQKAQQAYNTNQSEISALFAIVEAGKINVYQFNEDGVQEFKEGVTIADAMDILKGNQTTLNKALVARQNELAAIENEAESRDLTEDDQRQILTEAVEDAQLKVDNQTKVVDALKAAIDQLSAETPAE